MLGYSHAHNKPCAIPHRREPRKFLLPRARITQGMVMRSHVGRYAIVFGTPAGGHTGVEASTAKMGERKRVYSAEPDGAEVG